MSFNHEDSNEGVRNYAPYLAMVQVYLSKEHIVALDFSDMFSYREYASWLLNNEIVTFE